ncbi:MAG: rubrerythrin family protein [Ruminococcus sp.]|nr:rubrerythrin family protein [Ruminococcus sp.]
MKTWVCTICGHIHNGDTPPEVCPICNQPAEKFAEKEEE